MRISEIVTIKPRKPLTLAQARIATKTKQVDQARDNLKRERDSQKQAKERDQQRKALNRR